MQVTLVESEIHQAIELYLGQLMSVDKAETITIELEAKRDALGTRAYVSLTPNRVGAPAGSTPVSAPVTSTPRPVTTPVEAAPVTALGDVPAPGLDTSEAAPAECATGTCPAPQPAPVQSTPVAIADPSQVKPRTPRTPAEAVAWMEANPEPEVEETTPVKEETDESQAEETAAEEADTQVPNAVEPTQVVVQSAVVEVENPVSESVPQPVTDVVPVAEPTASTQVEDLSPKVVEAETNGVLQTEVSHSDPALPTGVPEPEVVSVPSDAVVTVKDETTNELPTPAAPVETPVEGEAAPRRSLFRS